jgi:hypothetical protein
MKKQPKFCVGNTVKLARVMANQRLFPKYQQTIGVVTQVEYGRYKVEWWNPTDGGPSELSYKWYYQYELVSVNPWT